MARIQASPACKRPLRPTRSVVTLRNAAISHSACLFNRRERAALLSGILPPLPWQPWSHLLCLLMLKEGLRAKFMMIASRAASIFDTCERCPSDTTIEAYFRSRAAARNEWIFPSRFLDIGFLLIL